MNNRGGDSRINEGKEEAEEKDVKFWTHTHTHTAAAAAGQPPVL